MSNEPNQPAEDAPKPTPRGSASPNARDVPGGPDVPPADAERIAASEAAAASAGEPRMTTPASTGLGSGDAEPEVRPEAGAGAREQPVAGNEPATPAGPTAVTGARPAPSADPVATGTGEPASEAPAADEPSTGGGVAAASAAGGAAADEPAGTAGAAGANVAGGAGGADSGVAGPAGGGVPPARPVGEVPPGPGASAPGVAPADSIDDSITPGSTAAAAGGAAAGGAAAGGAAAGRTAAAGSTSAADPTAAAGGAAAGGAAAGEAAAGRAAAGGAAPAPTPADPGSAAVPRAGDSGDHDAKPSGAGRKVLIVAAIVVLAAVVVFGVVRLAGGGSTEAGDCVDVTSEFEDNPEVKSLDCDDDRASFKIGAVVDDMEAACPDEGSYSEVSAGDGGRKLCLLPNMVEGACYQPEEAGTGFDKSECAGPSTIKVTKVVQGSTDLEACPDSAGMSYPQPPVTYCLAPAEE
ncbi:hypothetical protein ACFV4N_06910 [Actinosynnema sp. NPDC059797]